MQEQEEIQLPGQVEKRPTDQETARVFLSPDETAEIYIEQEHLTQVGTATIERLFDLSQERRARSLRLHTAYRT
jgi:hypothetical protein